MKYFRMSYEEVVFRRSFINIMLLNRSIPSFNIDKDEDSYGGFDRGIKTTKPGKSKVPRPESQHPSDFFMQFM